MSMTPWKENSKPLYARQEARTAKKKGARAQLNSGRTWSGLRDVVLNSPIGRILIDNKQTNVFSYTITLDEWVKLKRDANRTPPGCQPALQIDIQAVHLLVIEEATWDEIVSHIEMLEARINEMP